MRGIDHLVLAGHDLAAMRARYAGLGFMLTPPARHPFGTANSLVQFDRCFLELLSVAEPASIPEPMPGRFSFAAFNRDFLSVGEGCSMLVLDSQDARSDVAAFRAAGLTTYEPFDFSRPAKLPSGEEVTVGFSLAFVTHPDMPRAGFFTCQQHAPEHFWKREYQTHANGAETIIEVALVAREPELYADFLESFVGATASFVGTDSVAVPTGRGQVMCVSPKSFESRYGSVSPALDHGPVFGGFAIAAPAPGGADVHGTRLLFASPDERSEG